MRNRLLKLLAKAVWLGIVAMCVPVLCLVTKGRPEVHMIDL
jgi:hypothetical protein